MSKAAFVVWAPIPSAVELVVKPAGASDFATVPMACAAGLGVAMFRNVSAPDFASLTTCGETVGSVTS